MRSSSSLLRNLSADALARRDLVPICVIQDTLLFLNARCASLLGREARDLPEGVPLREVVAEADWPRVARSLRRTPTMKPGSGLSIMFSAVRKDGSIVDLELIGTAVAERGGTYVVAVVNDITARVRDDARLNYLAFSDGLTGLANRTLFLDRLHQSLLASRRTGDRFAVLACDLDGFKAVNDTYGHEAGDRVLQVAADMLRLCCREADTAARTGGDEFALILPGIADPYDAALVASRVIAALAEPIPIDGASCSVGISVGIAIYPRDGQTIEMLVQAADAAMYASKAGGRNRSSFAGPGRLGGKRSGGNRVIWSSAHRVGIGTLDEQHRTLAEKVAKVGAAFSAGRDPPRMRAALAELVALARAHFAAEEALMDRYLIADRATHKQAHRRLLQDALSLVSTSSGSSMSITAGLLHEWLLRHVDTADRELARQLGAKGYVEGGCDEERSLPASP